MGREEETNIRIYHAKHCGGHLPRHIWFLFHDSATKLYSHFAKEEGGIKQCIPGRPASWWVAELRFEFWSLLASKGLSLHTLFPQQGVLHFGNSSRKEGWEENSKINFYCKMSEDRGSVLLSEPNTGALFYPWAGSFLNIFSTTIIKGNKHISCLTKICTHQTQIFYLPVYTLCFTVLNLKHKNSRWSQTQALFSLDCKSIGLSLFILNLFNC